MSNFIQAPHISTRAKASFPVRHLRFDFSSTQRYWFGGDACATHLMNAMSSVFPRGELMLINALRNIRPLINDPKLQAEISGFIGQEAIHAREHMAFNRYADQQEIDIEKLERRVDRLYTLMQKFLPSMHIMAVGCAIEHITATLGSELLGQAHWNEKMHGPVGELWLWHAIEEIEHKAVFFDAYIAAGGGYVLRSFYMAVAGYSVFLLIVSGWLYLLRRDRQLKVGSMFKFLSQFIGTRGLVNLGSTRALLDYFRPSFHPNDHDTKALEQKWRTLLKLATHPADQKLV